MTDNDLQELDLLLEQLCDGVLDKEPSAVSRLIKLLEESEACRHRYLDTLSLHAALWRMGECGASTSDGESVGGFPHNPEMAMLSERTSSQSPFHFVTVHNPLTGLASGWPAAYLIAAVVLAIGALIGTYITVSQPVHIASDSPSTSHGVESPWGKKDVVGHITGMAGCNWAGTDRVAREVALGSTYELNAGLAEITYNTGARVILQGPCTYEVESAAGGYLSLGKVTVRVEKKEERTTKNEELSASSSSFLIPHSYFAVRTPTAVVTDLGTEFGIEVKDNGVTWTEVFVGEVQVSSANSRSKLEVLRAGQTARIDQREVVRGSKDLANSDATEFIRVIPAIESSTARAADVYAKLVLSMQPVAYYRMERPNREADGGMVLDSGPFGYPGLLRLADSYGGDPWLPGRFGSAISFRGPDIGDCAFVPNYPQATNDQLTLSAWVYLTGRRPRFMTIASNWGETLPPRGQFLFGLELESDLVAQICDRNGKWATVREGESHPLPIRQWQHVAFVVDQSVVRLYRNGLEVASGPCNGIRPDHNLPTLVIGTRSDDTGEGLPDVPVNWNGRIDELAIFHQALSPEQVHALHRGGTSDQDASESTKVNRSNATSLRLETTIQP